MTWDVKLGAAIFSNDGKQLGKVGGLVVDPDSMEMLEIILHHGFMFGTDRIVEMVRIDHVGEDGSVHLDVDAVRAEALPPLIRSQYVVASTTRAGSTPFAVGGGPTMTMPVMWRSSAGGSMMQVSDQDRYLAAVAEAAPVEVRSDLPVESVVIKTSTDVVASDDQKVGNVEDILYDESGELTGFIVKAGHFHHHDFTVPISNVAAITQDHVRLNVDAEAARPT
jgi:uncharacterized protein YrrD